MHFLYAFALTVARSVTSLWVDPMCLLLWSVSWSVFYNFLKRQASYTYNAQKAGKLHLQRSKGRQATLTTLKRQASYTNNAQKAGKLH